MKKYLVIVKDLELQGILSGSQQFLIRGFKKRPEFLGLVAVGDLVYFRLSKGEVLGQFVVGGVALIEGVEMIEKYAEGSVQYAENMNVLLVVKVEKLEQFIASPIEVPKSRKEWVVLD